MWLAAVGLSGTWLEAGCAGIVGVVVVILSVVLVVIIVMRSGRRDDRSTRRCGSFSWGRRHAGTGAVP